MERLTNMIKALRCVASQNVEGDCYADIQNYMHITDDKFKRLVCRDGKNFKDFINGKESVTCPFYQKEYGCSFEDGELFWINNVADLLEKLEEYQHLEEQGLLIKLPCKVGDTLYDIRQDNVKNRRKDMVHELEVEVVSVKFVPGETWKARDVRLNEIGKTVFLTRAEAEQRLKEMESES